MHEINPGPHNPAGVVEARFRRSNYPPLWQISCAYKDGLLVMRGTVPSFYLKQVAQEYARHTPGVDRVDNGLHIVRSSSAIRASSVI
jgi:osmotically-inducible protein OsmY